MTDNSDNDFSLKEWVMKRAANQPADAVYKLASNGAALEPRRDQPDIQEQAAERVLGSKAEAVKSQDKAAQEKARMTRFTNGVAPAVSNNGHTTNGHKQTNGVHNSAHQAVQQLQIVRLLQDLGERLRNSEKEREILWKELDGCRKLLTDIEDKTSKTEKAYLTLEHKVAQNDATDVTERQAEMEKINRALLEKIEAVETIAGSAVLRVEDAITENGKLARRLEQMSQDKSRLLRKLETMEETLTQTQDSLKAKALVLLTDQALAARTPLPQAPAWSGNDTLRMTAPQPQPSQKPAMANEALIDGGSLFRRTTRINTTLLVSFAVLGIAGGWALSKLKVPDLKIGAPSTAVETPQATSDVAPSQEQVMNQIAQLASQVEPGANVTDLRQPSSEEQARADEEAMQLAEKASAAAFRSERPEGTLTERIEPDTTLPTVVRDIENRAFGGDAEAQHDLAAIYTAGHAGVKTNYARAAEWFTEAAYSNVANAQYNLGVLYHQGLGVQADTNKAIQLYRVAATNGHPEAQYNLGIAHIEGVGADYNPRIATRYFEKAAAGGIVEAAYNLGLIYENRLIEEATPDEAVFWYKTAADAGNGQAKQALIQLQKASKLSEQDVARMYNRVAVMKPNAFEPKQIAEQMEPKVVKPAEVAAVIDQLATAPQKAAPAEPARQAAAVKYDAVIVAQIQEKLAELGLYDGPADGAVGAATEDAVKAYQAQNKLKADGKPTEDVLVHMLATEMQVTRPAAGSDN